MEFEIPDINNLQRFTLTALRELGLEAAAAFDSLRESLTTESVTDDDLDKVSGQFDVFVGLLQEKYGYSREHAEEEIEKQMNEYEARLKTSMPNS